MQTVQQAIVVKGRNVDKHLCEECKYSEWDVEEYYGNASQAFICGCKKADKAETTENKYGEVIECSEYESTPPEWH